MACGFYGTYPKCRSLPTHTLALMLLPTEIVLYCLRKLSNRFFKPRLRMMQIIKMACGASALSIALCLCNCCHRPNTPGRGVFSRFAAKCVVVCGLLPLCGLRWGYPPLGSRATIVSSILNMLIVLRNSIDV